MISVLLFTTRFVEANDYQEAELKALELLKADPFWKDPAIKGRSPDARIYFEEIEEVVQIPEDEPNQGHVFYKMEDSEEE